MAVKLIPSFGASHFQTALLILGFLTSITFLAMTQTKNPFLETGLQASADESSNQSPQCISLNANPLTGGARLSVTFTGMAVDADGIIKNMEFQFGDGSSENVVVTNGETNKMTETVKTHLYTRPGIYQAVLRVKDNSGRGNEWSSIPEACKVRIEVKGEILGTTPPKELPKSGLGSAWPFVIISSGLLGIALKILARPLSR